MIEHEQEQFNMAIASLMRMDRLFQAAHNGFLEGNYRAWFNCLESLQREAGTLKKEEEIKINKLKSKVEFSLIARSKKEQKKLLDQYEKGIRGIMEKKGILHVKSDDPAMAIRR